MKKQNGITLIALVISIIVMLILAGVTINAVIGDEGIIAKTQVASIMSKFSKYKEELELNAVEDMEIYASSEAIKNYIPSMSDKDIEKFVIMKRELLYIENDELEIKAAEACGIGTVQTADETTSNSINEVKAIINGVINLSSNPGDTYKVPEDDFTEATTTNDTSVGLIGTRLYDKNSINSETWNIVIEYNSANQEVARYGSGYYWLKSGETYTIDGKSMKFENDFVIDYANKTYIALSGRAVNWNLDATLAVSNGLVLNIDPMSLADGEWRQNEEDNNFYDFYVKDPQTGKEEYKEIQKTGDVVYDATTRALKFNENIFNVDGKGGYLRLADESVDFSYGFSFELYVNFSRMREDIGCTGFFSRTKYFYDGYPEDADMLRFGWDTNKCVGLFGRHDTEPHTGYNMLTSTAFYLLEDNPGYKEGEDVYITWVYTPYYEHIDRETYDDKMKSENLDKLEYYINGKLFAYGYHSHDGYVASFEEWNDNSTCTYIGAAPWYGFISYIKGNVYTTRLYAYAMDKGEVKENYDTTLKYRSSF